MKYMIYKIKDVQGEKEQYTSGAVQTDKRVAAAQCGGYANLVGAEPI